MDFDNSMNKQYNEFNNNIDKPDLQSQLEILRERLKNKEDEIFLILSKQKEEYENLIKEKDEEISRLLDQLVGENTDLKRQIINMEIDYECLKESYYEGQEKLKEAEANNNHIGDTFQNTNSLIDKQFFNSLKNIEDNHNKKQKEITDKYDNTFKNLSREHRVSIANIRKICFENKNKLVNNIQDDEENLSTTQVEELLFQFENKIKLIYEDMKNKEKYISVIEQKYEMINEENKFLKRKVTEEKTILLKQIEDIQREREINHNEMVKKFEDEIAVKKDNLQKQIQTSMESNEKLILSLTKERDELLENVNGLKKNITDIRNELTMSLHEREELDALLMGKEVTQKSFNENIEKLHKEIYAVKQDKAALTKVYDEINVKFQDLNTKKINLELTNKVLNDNLLNINNELKRTIEDNDKKRTALVNSYGAEIYELNKKNQEYKQNLENEMRKSKKDENSNEEMKLRETIEKLKMENNDVKVKIKIISQEKDEEKRNRDKFENNTKSLNNELEKLSQEIKRYKDKINELDSSNKSLNYDFNTLKKNYNQLQSLTESQKNSLKELEKVNEKSQKYSILDNTNNELRRELLESKQYINKLYDNIKRLNDKYPNLKLSIRQLEDDAKILDEVENYIRDLILKKNEITSVVNREEIQKSQKLREENDKLSKLINDITNEKIKYDEEIRSLKKKLLYHNINLSNQYFKALENSKQSQNALYESILVFTRNLNLKYFIDLYEIKVENEEEKHKIIVEKKLTNDLKNCRKYELLIQEFNDFKKECQVLFNEFDIRSKNYFNPEELSLKYSEFKTYCEEMFDFIFSTFITHKDAEFEDYILFKMPVNTFNQIIEKIHEGLEEFDKKINILLLEYSKQSSNIKNALDLVIKQTKIDNELIERILSNPVSNKLI